LDLRNPFVRVVGEAVREVTMVLLDFMKFVVGSK